MERELEGLQFWILQAHDGDDTGYEPEFCCNGYECGCMGRPINYVLSGDELPNPKYSPEIMFPKEHLRIAFLNWRDGITETHEWAQLIMRGYRKAVLNKNHYASNPVYRKMFILSYLDLKRFVLMCERMGM